LLLDKNHDIKLCDFGWSTQRAKHEKMRTFCGTYEYMSPELLQKKSYDYTVDIWGLGILLFELMHGYSPYRAKKIEDIYSNIVHKRMKISSRCSKEVKDLLQRILKIKPAERISIEDILRHPWVLRYSKLQKLKELQERPRREEKQKVAKAPVGQTVKVARKLF
jgi:serine/threonine protein kinase